MNKEKCIVCLKMMGNSLSTVDTINGKKPCHERCKAAYVVG